jgi:signal transduction histidine kinase
VDNAIAATHGKPGGGQILIDLAHHRVSGHEVLRIAISDDGAGMDAASLARAWEACAWARTAPPSSADRASACRWPAN